MTSPAGFVVGISGPDGAGKSSLVEELVRRFTTDGIRVVRVYLYGCIVCRNLRRGPLARTAARRTPSAGALRTVHGIVDATELALRLWAARRIAASRATRPSARAAQRRSIPGFIVLTDRSPVDGLVKHAPRRGSLVDRAYRRLARTYDLLLLLDAPALELTDRDREHGPDALADLSARFAQLTVRSNYLVHVDTGGRTLAEVADDAERVLRAAWKVPSPPTIRDV
jgi:thymidylate kinase